MDKGTLSTLHGAERFSSAGQDAVLPTTPARTGLGGGQSLRELAALRKAVRRSGYAVPANPTYEYGLAPRHDKHACEGDAGGLLRPALSDQALISASTAAICCCRRSRLAQRRVAWPTLRPALKALP